MRTACCSHENFLHKIGSIFGTGPAAEELKQRPAMLAKGRIEIGGFAASRLGRTRPVIGMDMARR